jgi:hypothetical protein
MRVLSPTRGASRRAIAASYGGGRAFGRHLAKRSAQTVSQLLAGGLCAPGRSPVAAREQGGAFVSPPAGAASRSANITPHESALS